MLPASFQQCVRIAAEDAGFITHNHTHTRVIYKIYLLCKSPPSRWSLRLQAPRDSNYPQQTLVSGVYFQFNLPCFLIFLIGGYGRDG